MLEGRCTDEFFHQGGLWCQLGSGVLCSRFHVVRSIDDTIKIAKYSLIMCGVYMPWFIE